MKTSSSKRTWPMLLRIQDLATRLLSDQTVEHLIIDLIARKSARMPPDEALRFLFRLDAEQYKLHGKHAIRYGDGLHTKHRHMNYHQFFTKRIGPKDRVLDIGCGVGALAYSIAKECGACVVGVDYSSSSIEQAKESFSHERIIYVQEDIVSFMPEGEFTVVVLSNVLEHLHNRSMLLQRIARRTGAEKFLIRVPRFDRHWSVPLKKELQLDWRLDADHKTEYTPETFEREMRAASLITHHIEYRWDEIWAELRVDAPTR
jgi:SAM-dependent methyltransferase